MFCALLGQDTGERLQDNWSSGLFQSDKNSGCLGIFGFFFYRNVY